ncbi:hypothetical protein LTR97_007596 [Elasticomyces elasticus]|uniref:Glucanase n=1 Tax=Elasticomyces elasticus TaxID=574655 RepID=A0AAN8A033_9PEZI|nr:hypothetical protein LTR97_007596 [Elasticomyces elasticus]KAK5715584.1 hypothetical protein LTR15_010229 [Elasticomyces elasticus]
MARFLILSGLALLPFVLGQQIGKTAEIHPKLTTQVCTKKHGCVTQQTYLVLDALSHPIQNIKTGGSCTNSSGQLDLSVCATEKACAQNCALEGIDYAQHGVETQGSSLTLRQYLNISGVQQSVSPRLYLLGPKAQNYEMLQLLNQEFTFTVDVSNLPCGMNGALYFSEMARSGGRSNLNPAGASYGTGYCDAQCPAISWINGVANVDGQGACCQEMDIWEANARSTALTPHSCNITGLYECTGAACGGDGVCDKSGCGINPYAVGNHNYYGYSDTVDTTKPFTVVTQFHTTNGKSSGTLNEITRLYVQGGKVIQNVNFTLDGHTIDSITNPYCNATAPSFQRLGGLAQMGGAIGRGMVLAMSIWNDAGGNMTWLDTGNAGPCTVDEGAPAVIEATDPTTSVTFSNIKWGDFGTTYKSGPGGYYA